MKFAVEVLALPSDATRTACEVKRESLHLRVVLKSIANNLTLWTVKSERNPYAKDAEFVEFICCERCWMRQVFDTANYEVKLCAVVVVAR